MPPPITENNFLGSLMMRISYIIQLNNVNVSAISGFRTQNGIFLRQNIKISQPPPPAFDHSNDY